MNRKRVRLSFLVLVLILAHACATTAPPAPEIQVVRGVASWYGQEFAGRTTANGEIFDPLLLTAAHRTFPFGTVLDVRNIKTNQTVRIRINDRGPYIGDRMIDLSYGAAQLIGLVEPGRGEVELTVVKIGKGEREPPAPYLVTLGDTKTSAPMPAEPPAVDFPVPSAPATKAPRVAASSAPAVVDRVEVVEERGGLEMRRQVSADGKTIQTVPMGGSAPPQKPRPSPGAANAIESIPVIADAPVETRRQVAADGRTVETVAVDANGRRTATGETGKRATTTHDLSSPPGHSAAAKLDAVRQRPSPSGSVHAGAKFIVQVGAFAELKNATALQDQLRAAGFEPHIDNTSLHRVQIGPFDTREQAIKSRERLETAGVSAIIVMLDVPGVRAVPDR